MYSNAVTTVSPTYANEVLSGNAAGWMRTTLSRPEVKSKVCMLQGHCTGCLSNHCQCRSTINSTALTPCDGTHHVLNCMYSNSKACYQSAAVQHQSSWVLPLQVRGILNGIDTVEWNPATDSHLAANFSAQFPTGKTLCKRYVQKVSGSCGCCNTCHLGVLLQQP